MLLPTSSLTALTVHYPVVVIGTDVGGAVAASVLARTGQPVCVLERSPLPSDRKTSATAIDAAPDANAEAVKTYLWEGRHFGAHVFRGVDVRTVERGGAAAGWLVTFHLPGTGREKFEGPALFVTADVVVLAGGLQAAQILGRSRELGLALARDEGRDSVGRVYASDPADGQTQAPIHADLWVVGQAVSPPTADPVNAQAIAAQTKHSCALLAQERGWKIDHAATAPAEIPALHTPVSLRFTEAMKGYVSTKVIPLGMSDYQRGVRQGRDDGSRLEFVLTLIADDVTVINEAADHPAVSIGSVVAPALSQHPLMVAGGGFNLFVDQADASRRMKYRMKMVSREGRTYFMDGFKIIRDDPGFDVWSDTTTLYTTLFDGDSDASPPLACGVLRILPEDFARQLTTFQVENAGSLRQQIRAQTAFARLFIGTLFETYASLAKILPDVRRSGGIFRALLRLGALCVGSVALLGLLLWPWRPAVLRQIPAIAADGELDLSAIPADVAALGLFPQYLRALDLRAGAYSFEPLTLTAVLQTDTLVQDHGKLAPIPIFPAGISPLTDLPLRRAYLTLTRLHDTSGAPIGIGSQVEIASLDSNPLTHTINANTDWTLTLPNRGLLFLSQKEGGPDLGQLQAQAQKSGQTFRGERRFNHTLGPLPRQQGIVHGGTGQFEGVVGVFQEINTITAVTPRGNVEGSLELRLVLLRARKQVPAQRPEQDTAGRRGAGNAWRRTLEIRADDILYTVSGVGAARTDFIPASLGRLHDPVLSGTTVFLARLRDERGDVVGLAGACRLDTRDDKSPGDPRDAQWTLTFPGEGTLFAAAEASSNVPASLGFLGSRTATVLGGTGLFANVTGTMRQWPGSDSRAPIRLQLELESRWPPNH